MSLLGTFVINFPPDKQFFVAGEIVAEAPACVLVKNYADPDQSCLLLSLNRLSRFDETAFYQTEGAFVIALDHVKSKAQSGKVLKLVPKDQ